MGEGVREQPSSPALLEIANLSKRFSRSAKPAVADLSLSVGRGEILGFVGLNGAGKTTTIRIASGLNRPSAGRVSVAGFDVSNEKVGASKHLGLVPEFPYFYRGARALSLLRYLAGFRGLHGSEARTRSRALLDLVGLSGVERNRIGSFSQGMKKRFALAAALLDDPEVLLLDEVLNGLDPEGIAQVRGLLSEWRREGKAVLLSSHLLHEVQNVADRVAIIHAGRLVRVLSRTEIAEATTGVLVITFGELDSLALDYLSTVGSVEAVGTTVRVSNPTVPPEQINTELVRRGYRIKHLAFDRASLEDLFFRWIGPSASDPEAGGITG